MLRLLTDGQPSLCVCSALHMGVCVPFLRPKKAAKSGKNREGKAAGPYQRGAGAQILGGRKGKKIIDLSVGQINDTLWGKQYSLLFLQQQPGFLS